MKTVVFETDNLGQDYLKKKLAMHELVFCKEPLSENNSGMIKDADAILTFVHSSLNESTLKYAKNLKLVCTMSTGYDHIDVGYCKKSNITVCNVPDYGSGSVAEFAFALILCLAKKISRLTWFSGFCEERNVGVDISGRTMGLIGAGRIGINVIKMAKAFGMNVQVFDPYITDDLAGSIGFKVVGFEELLSTSDILSVHCPLTKATYRMINMRNIGLIKKGALLVNTARGGIVDAQALTYALEQGIISGAALDVIEGEREIKLGNYTSEYQRLKNMDNVILTHHHAYNTREALIRVLETTIKNIQCFSDGIPINVQNLNLHNAKANQ